MRFTFTFRPLYWKEWGPYILDAPEWLSRIGCELGIHRIWTKYYLYAGDNQPPTPVPSCYCHGFFGHYRFNLWRNRIRKFFWCKNI